MKAKIYSLQGASVGEIELPVHFSTELRPDIIARAVIAMQKNRRQAYGSDPKAGQRSSARYKGTRKGWGHSYNYGQARIPRLMIGGGRRVGRAKIVPQTVGGRETFPPQVREVRGERINDKERLFAIRSAIAATALKDVVKDRGHRVDSVLEFPLIVEDSLEEKRKAQEIKAVLEKLGLSSDLERTSEKNIRAGKGKTRGRRYRRKKGPLIVVGSDRGVLSAARNIAGVDVALVDRLNAELLAPGAKPGRLTVWTKSAVEKLSKLYGV